MEVSPESFNNTRKLIIYLGSYILKKFSKINKFNSDKKIIDRDETKITDRANKMIMYY